MDKCQHFLCSSVPGRSRGCHLVQCLEVRDEEQVGAGTTAMAFCSQAPGGRQSSHEVPLPSARGPECAFLRHGSLVLTALVRVAWGPPKAVVLKVWQQQRGAVSPETCLCVSPVKTTCSPLVAFPPLGRTWHPMADLWELFKDLSLYKTCSVSWFSMPVILEIN